MSLHYTVERVTKSRFQNYFLRGVLRDASDVYKLQSTFKLFNKVSAV